VTNPDLIEEAARAICPCLWPSAEPDDEPVIRIARAAVAVALERAAKALRDEQDRLDAEAGDYPMDTNDCIDVIRKLAGQ
jgi:hypothetical protein